MAAVPQGRAALPSELRLHCVDSINHGLELFHHRPLVPSRPLGRILHVLDVFKLEVVQPCGISRCEHPKEREQVRKLVPLWHIEADGLVIPNPGREFLVAVPANVPAGNTAVISAFFPCATLAYSARAFVMSLRVGATLRMAM